MNCTYCGLDSGTPVSEVKTFRCYSESSPLGEHSFNEKKDVKKSSELNEKFGKCEWCGMSAEVIEKEPQSGCTKNPYGTRGYHSFPPKPKEVPQEGAKRADTDFRYDVLDSDFLHCMAQIGSYGAEKYGDFNWHKSRLNGGKGPVNHIYDHLRQYREGLEHDHFKTRKHQLAAIAFNAMMEFWYLENLDGKETK